MKYIEAMERRKFSRIDFSTKALLETEKERFSARLKNIAYGGAYLISEKRPPLGKGILVRLFLSDLEPRIELRFKAEVVREGPDGFGVKFKSIDFSSLSHLRKILYYNLPDPDRAEKELKLLLGESLLEL